MAANSTFVQMENKQNATEILPKVSFSNDYSEFIIDATERKGDYIVEDALDEMSAQGVNTSILADGEVPSIAEVSYNTRRSANYIYKVREDELKKAAVSQEAYDELLARINANLDQQDLKDCWREFPKMLLKDELNFKSDMIAFGTVQNAYKTNLRAMMEDIRKCKYPSDKYNVYSKTVDGTTYTLKTFSDRPVIFIRADYLDELRVEFESGVFNLDKIALEADIYVVPCFYDYTGTTEDSDVLWMTCDRRFPRIFKDFEKRARLEDVRSFNIGKAVTYIEYTSKLVPCIIHTKYDPNA